MRSTRRSLWIRWELAYAAARVHRSARVLAAFAVLIIAALPPAAAAAESQYARNYRMAGDASRVRLVIEFDREPDLRWFMLGSPHRLIFDFKQTRLAFAPEDIKARGLVANVRLGATPDDSSRLALTMKGAFIIERVDVLKNEVSPGYRLVADLAAASDRQFKQALAEQSQVTGSTEKAPEAGNGEGGQAPRFRIVVDAGHGGFDGGAKGVNGTTEKDVTLTFATELRDRLAALGRYDVFMTRNKDEFLALDERVAIARRYQADLLISIHADTINVPELHGATVYTVSDKASDPVAEATAVRENLSDELAGIEVAEDDGQVADILVDLVRRETHGFSARFARALVAEFSRSIGMIKNPHRSAGFRVLRAPDIPSVLIELGYLSNTKDEAKLGDAGWRSLAIDGVVEAIGAFGSDRLADGR